MTANFMFFGSNFTDSGSGTNYRVGGYIEYSTVVADANSWGNGMEAWEVFPDVLGGEKPKNTEVWFIDRGPRIATTVAAGNFGDNLDWGEKKSNYLQASGGNIDNDYNVNDSNWNCNADGELGKGIRKKTDGTFKMEIGMGGIKEVTFKSKYDHRKTEGFFNIGDW